MKKVCIIGLGEMGKRHAKDLLEFSDNKINIAGVFDPSDASYARACKWIGKEPERFGTIEEMLKKVNPDGCVISSPNYLHLDCLNKFRGKIIPLILEKPLDTSLEKVAQVVRFAEEYQAPIMVHHVMRYAPIVTKAKELIDTGKIGKLAGFEMSQFIHGSMFHNFRRTFRTGGGQLLEKATHDFDILLFLAGAMPKKVGAICKRQRYGGDKPNDLRCSKCDEVSDCEYSLVQAANSNDTVSKDDLCVFAKEIDIYDFESCLIELENGISGTYSECFFSKSPFSRRYEFIGTGGFISIDFSAKKIYIANDDGEEEFYFDYEGRIHYNGAPGVTRHFLELMEGKIDKVISPVSDAFAAELISFAAYKSNELEEFVNVSDLKTCCGNQKG